MFDVMEMQSSCRLVKNIKHAIAAPCTLGGIGRTAVASARREDLPAAKDEADADARKWRCEGWCCGARTEAARRSQSLLTTDKTDE